MTKNLVQMTERFFSNLWLEAFTLATQRKKTSKFSYNMYTKKFMIKDIMNYDCCDQNLSISESKNQKINFNL
jgi:hypothetical protein